MICARSCADISSGADGSTFAAFFRCRARVFAETSSALTNREISLSINGADEEEADFDFGFDRVITLLEDKGLDFPWRIASALSGASLFTSMSLTVIYDDLRTLHSVLSVPDFIRLTVADNKSPRYFLLLIFSQSKTSNHCFSDKKQLHTTYPRFVFYIEKNHLTQKWAIQSALLNQN